MNVGNAGNVGALFSAATVVSAVENSRNSNAPRKSPPGVTSQEMAPPPSKAQDVEAQQDRWLSDPDALMEDEEREEKPLDENQVSLLTKELNELMSSINCNLQFDYHKEVDMMTVRMIDKETNEVIKEMPPEEMIKNMENAQTWIGALLDTYA